MNDVQLLVLILKKEELIDELIKKLAESGVSGGTIIDGTGMAEALNDMEDLPAFGFIRQILGDNEKEPCKIMMFVLKDEKAITTRKTIKKVIGSLEEPNTGIMFAVPITNVEGIGE